MKTRILFLLFILITLIGSITSCDKHHAKKLSGKYSCKVEYHYWDMLPTHIDSTFFEDIEIKQDGKNVIVLGYTIHIDSLWQEKEYTAGYIHNYIKVQFKRNNVYITSSSGGLGGNATYIYEGTKK